MQRQKKNKKKKNKKKKKKDKTDGSREKWIKVLRQLLPLPLLLTLNRLFTYF